MKLTINERKLPLILLIVGMCISLAILYLPFLFLSNDTGIVGLTARTEDKGIYLSWDCINPDKLPQILKIVTSEESYSIELPHHLEEYMFLDGQHGNLYGFEVSLKGESFNSENRLERMFLDWDKIPDLPIVEIETEHGEWPTYTVVETPENYWGATITNNNYVQGKITLSGNELLTINTACELRYRGNASAAILPQKSFAIKLDKPLDLLGRDNNQHADRQWGLIPGRNCLRTESGLYVSKLCGMDWQPAYLPVNVMINGDWMGPYLLIETVKRSPARVDIGHDGFLIENCAYWWKPGENYFKTPSQIEQMGYVIKYPDVDTISESSKDEIVQFMSAYEEAVLSLNGSFKEYIDIDSFCGWLLIHDILGNEDGAGSNMFLSKDSMNDDSKLKLGPAWDFDGSFLTEGYWSEVHSNTDIMYFRHLLKDPVFCNTFQSKWDALSDNLCEEMDAHLNGYIDRYGDALQESWNLGNARYHMGNVSVDEVLESTKLWFRNRKIWLDSAMKTLEQGE